MNVQEATSRKHRIIGELCEVTFANDCISADRLQFMLLFATEELMDPLNTSRLRVAAWNCVFVKQVTCTYELMACLNELLFYESNDMITTMVTQYLAQVLPEAEAIEGFMQSLTLTLVTIKHEEMANQLDSASTIYNDPLDRGKPSASTIGVYMTYEPAIRGAILQNYNHIFVSNEKTPEAAPTDEWQDVAEAPQNKD